MPIITLKIFYTTFIFQNIISSLAYDIHADIEATMKKIYGSEPTDLKQDKENFAVAYTISEKIKNFIKEPNYEAIMALKDKLKEFFEFPFKYFSNIFKNLFNPGKKKSAVRLFASNFSTVVPSENRNLRARILIVRTTTTTTTTTITTTTTTTEENEVYKLNEICSMSSGFPPAWCLKPQHYFRF